MYNINMYTIISGRVRRELFLYLTTLDGYTVIDLKVSYIVIFSKYSGILNVSKFRNFWKYLHLIIYLKQHFFR